MPIQSFLCGNCSHDFTEYYKLSSVVPDRLECPKCKIFSATRQFPCVHTHKDFAKPVQMYSLAPVNHEDVMELKAKIGEVQMSIDPADEMYGIPIARNETERQQVLKAAGFVDKAKPK